MRASKRTAATLVGCAIAVSSVLASVAAADNPHGTPPGQAKKEQAQAANSQPTTSDNSTGVKPSSTTGHDTTAQAGSNKTKQYGNGKTAGEIAMQNGAGADTQLHGPGNSQPHKVAVCSKNGKSHEVDVHALKSHGAGSCASGSQGQTKSESKSETKSQTSGTAPSSPSAPAQAPASAPVTSSAAGVAGVQTSVGQSQARRGVLGARVTTGKPVTRRARPAHAVLGTADFTG
jgi:hypothetical protein